MSQYACIITLFYFIFAFRGLLWHELEGLGQMLLAERQFAVGPDFNILFVVG